MSFLFRWMPLTTAVLRGQAQPPWVWQWQTPTTSCPPSPGLSTRGESRKVSIFSQFLSLICPQKYFLKISIIDLSMNVLSLDSLTTQVQERIVCPGKYFLRNPIAGLSKQLCSWDLSHWSVYENKYILMISVTDQSTVINFKILNTHIWNLHVDIGILNELHFLHVVLNIMLNYRSFPCVPWSIDILMGLFVSAVHVGSLINTLTATDPDAGARLEYHIKSDSFTAKDKNGNPVTSTTPFNYEVGPLDHPFLNNFLFLKLSSILANVLLWGCANNLESTLYNN